MTTKAFPWTLGAFTVKVMTAVKRRSGQEHSLSDLDEIIVTEIVNITCTWYSKCSADICKLLYKKCYINHIYLILSSIVKIFFFCH